VRCGALWCIRDNAIVGFCSRNSLRSREGRHDVLYIENYGRMLRVMNGWVVLGGSIYRYVCM